MNKNQRVLDIYARLCEGKMISKAEESLKFGVDERSIQRDIDDIRAFLNTRAVEDVADQRKIAYNRVKKGYEMTGCEGSMMSNSEILAVSKILLESRAFTKEEIDSILNKMIAGCVPLKNMKLVSDLISNEKFHYVAIRSSSAIHEKLWELGEEIQKHNLIELVYQKQVYLKETVKRIVQPVAILFSEYYFYLNAYIVEKIPQYLLGTPRHRLDAGKSLYMARHRKKLAMANRHLAHPCLGRVELLPALHLPYPSGSLLARCH